jgi:hypothetical protein
MAVAMLRSLLAISTKRSDIQCKATASLGLTPYEPTPYNACARQTRAPTAIRGDLLHASDLRPT